MKKDKLIKLAQQAGFVIDEVAQQHQPNCIFHTHHMVDEMLERFAKLVAADEGETCAKLCERKMPNPTQNWADAQIVRALEKCAASIRARKKQ